METGNDGEYGAWNEHIVEVGNQEHRIMILIVGAGHRQHNAGYAADREDRNKGKRVEHRRRKADSTLRSVKSQLNILIPVGTAIAIVVMEKKLLTMAP